MEKHIAGRGHLATSGSPRSAKVIYIDPSSWNHPFGNSPKVVRSPVEAKGDYPLEGVRSLPDSPQSTSAFSSQRSPFDLRFISRIYHSLFIPEPSIRVPNLSPFLILQ